MRLACLSQFDRLRTGKSFGISRGIQKVSTTGVDILREP
jgi:hypothetical protein